MSKPLIILMLVPAAGLALMLVRFWGIRRRKQQRLRAEDALKAILTAELEHRVVSPPGLAGLLGLSYETTINLVEDICGQGLVSWGEVGLELTPAGRGEAIRLLRAHRLTERYLADEAGMSMDRIHALADRAEHALSEAQLAELNEKLGHPDWDPHGDPIPDARGGVMASDREHLDAWPTGQPGVIAHVEDEPPEALRRLLALGLRPGGEIEVIERGPDMLKVRIGQLAVELSPALARQVHVRSSDEAIPAERPGRSLAELATGQTGRIVCLRESCRGFTRRRLLDFGLTPGALIQPEMKNAGGSARAYRIRDTLIVLRREQAEQIVVEEWSTVNAKREARR